ANVLPDFDSDGSVREIAVEAIDCGLDEVRLQEAIGIDGGAKRGVSVRRLDEGHGSGALPVQWHAARLFVVYNEDVDEVQSPAFEYGGESGIALLDGSVRVDRLQSGQRTKITDPL